jgi:UDP-GlcNAc:undecaprenyl-phosphate GlcNAc-1-phosphate transferase
MRDYLFILLIAAAVTYLLTPLVRRGAVAMRAQHAARDRDVHVEPTPLLGGVAMYGGVAAAILVATRLSYLSQAFPSGRTVTGLLLAGGLLVLIGIIDDRWGMSPVSKLAGQVAAGGVLAWSGVYLSWIALPGGEYFVLEPDLSYTVTILIVVITINAVNFIDGLDGLAAGVVGISALSYMVYSYKLANSVGIPSQSVPAVVSAVLAGACIGFLPHNFNPAKIFMGDTGAMLLGLLLAYGPISTAATLDQSVLTDYGQLHPLNRFPTILPLLVPVAIMIIPYTDLLLAVIRRTLKGMSPFDADRLHLHHRLLNMGHSQRQSVLLMYLWAALFNGLVVGLSVVRIRLIWLALVTVAIIAVLSLATMPKLRPWRPAGSSRHGRRRASRIRSADPQTVTGSIAAPANGTANGAAPGALPPLLAAPTSVPAPVGPAPAGTAPLSPAPVNPAPAGPPPNGALPAAAPLPTTSARDTRKIHQ